MSALRRLALAALALALGACAGLAIDPADDCAAACERAYACGLLPSTLGYGATAELAQADCLRLCNNTPGDGATASLLVPCLTAAADEENTPGWCDDETDADAHALGLQCSATASCLGRTDVEASTFGTVELEVQLITYAEFVERYDLAALAELYANDTADAPTASLRSCNLALCGRTTCARSDDLDDVPPCDAALCGGGMFQTAQTCDDLAARTVDILVAQTGAPIASQVLLDADEPSVCATTSATFDSATYHLRPGPLTTSARVAGTLSVAELERIGYPVPADADPADLLDYCLRFPGRDIQARSGDSRTVVPIADIDGILLQFPGEDAPRPTPCTP